LWSSILQALLPDVHADVTQALKEGKGMSSIIPMFENSPITAAFSVYRTHGNRRDKERWAFEWDVFLSPQMVSSWLEHEADRELRKKIMADILETLLVAHGSPFENALETVVGSHQYASIRHRPKTQHGGLLAIDWMDMFARALSLAAAASMDAEEVDEVAAQRRIKATDESTKHTFAADRRFSFKDSVSAFQRHSGLANFAVILDMKHYSPAYLADNWMPRLLSELIAELNDNDIVVEAIASFDFHKFPSSSSQQSVKGAMHEPPTNIKMFHHAGGLQQALHAEVPIVCEGDTVMFNAASLIKFDEAAETAEALHASLALDEPAIGCLAVYQRLFMLRIGLYVQENDLCADAYELIARMVNANPDIFELGFAWGGLGGRVPADITPSEGDFGWAVPCGLGEQNSILLGERRWRTELSVGTLMMVWLETLDDAQRPMFCLSLPATMSERLSESRDDEFAAAMQNHKIGGVKYLVEVVIKPEERLEFRLLATGAESPWLSQTMRRSAIVEGALGDVVR